MPEAGIDGKTALGLTRSAERVSPRAVNGTLLPLEPTPANVGRVLDAIGEDPEGLVTDRGDLHGLLVDLYAWCGVSSVTPQWRNKVIQKFSAEPWWGCASGLTLTTSFTARWLSMQNSAAVPGGWARGNGTLSAGRPPKR